MSRCTPRRAFPVPRVERNASDLTIKSYREDNEPFEEDALKKQLWPDQAAYVKEEQRRFEILAAHWDLPIKIMELDGK